MSGASAVAMQTRTRQARPIVAARLRRNWREARRSVPAMRRGGIAARSSTRRSPVAAISVPDARIERRVEEVGDHVGEEEEGGDDEGEALDHREVAVDDGVEHRRAHAGDGEDVLD